MRQSVLIFILLATILSSCTNADLASDSQKVIVVHARGISYPEMQEYLATTKTDSFFKGKNKKGLVKELTPITNAVTITNIASFETGDLPNEHGIVGHLYAKKVDETLQLANGFTQAFETEAFWEKADLSGKNVLNIGSLTLHGKYQTHKNVDALSQGKQVGKPQLVSVFPADSIESKSVVAYKVSTEDSITNGHVLYKTNTSTDLFLDDDYNPENGIIKRMEIGKWFHHDNLNAKLFHHSEDTLGLYIRPSYVNNGYPEDFVSGITDSIGSPTGWPNIRLHTSGHINESTLLEEIYNEIHHLMDVFSFSSTKKDYDLIMLDYPLMDRLGHAFLGSTNKKEIYRKAFKQMDEDFHAIETFAKKNGYELIITSGHGFSLIHTSIDINKFLTSSGVNTDSANENWEAIGIPGKVSAHIYINENLDEERKEEVMKRIESSFDVLQAKEQLVVDEIYRKEAQHEIGLSHANSGDLFVLLNPGFVFENNTTKSDVFGSPQFRGDHGYSLKHKESYAVLISDVACQFCKATDVAGMVEEILDI